MIHDEVAIPIPVSETAMKANSSVVKIAIIEVFGLAIGVFFYLDLGRFLSLTALKDNRDHLLAFTEANDVGAAALFVLCYISVTGLSLPGAVILTLAGRFLFGSVFGTLLVNLGATIAFLVASHLLRDWVEQNLVSGWVRFSKGFAQERVQLSHDPPADPALSVFCGESGIRSDSDECRHLCGGYGARDYPRFLRLCLRGPATRYDQFVERHCFSQSHWGICLAGASGACAESATRNGLGNQV